MKMRIIVCAMLCVCSVVLAGGINQGINNPVTDADTLDGQDGAYYASKTEMYEAISDTLNARLYGSVAAHPTIPATATLSDTLDGLWIQTNVLAVGTNTIGTFAETNQISGVLNAGVRDLEWYSSYTGIGGPTLTHYVEYLAITNNQVVVLATSEVTAVSAVITENTSYLYVLENFPVVATATNYQAVRLKVIRTGGVNASYLTYGGSTTYDSHIQGPSASSGTFQPYSDNLTDLAATGDSSYFKNAANLTNLHQTVTWVVPDPTNNYLIALPLTIEDGQTWTVEHIRARTDVGGVTGVAHLVVGDWNAIAVGSASVEDLAFSTAGEIDEAIAGTATVTNRQDLGMFFSGLSEFAVTNSVKVTAKLKR